MSGVGAPSRDRTVGSQNTQSPGRSRVASGPTARTRPIAPAPGTTGVGNRYRRAPLHTPPRVGRHRGEGLSGARRYLLPTPGGPGAGAIGRVRAVGPDPEVV